ncbi:MAG TPA: hypothetical protein DHU71_08825 [Erythrobacter sp.]|nr:hypothetical protein [Erythrobacter sp.]
MDQRLRRALLSFAREEDAVAIVRAQQLHEFEPRERIVAAAGRAFGQSGGRCQDDAIRRDQRGFDPRTRHQFTERTRQLFGKAIIGPFLVHFGETPQQIGLAAADALELELVAGVRPSQANILDPGRSVAPGIARSRDYRLLRIRFER